MAKIRHLMTPSPYSVGVEQPVAEAARRMQSHHIRHLPALRGGQLEGLISERDIALVRALPFDLGDITVEEAMMDSPYVVTPDTPSQEAASRLCHLWIGCLPVVEEEPGGLRLVGIITENDLLRAAYDTH